MSRLTKKISKTVQDKYSLGSYLCYDFSNTDNINELLNKLGRIEDFMEELGIEDLGELKDAMQELLETNNHIKEVSDKYYICYKEKFNRVLELAEECQALKDRWEKLKQFIQKDHDWNLEQDNNDCALAERWVLEEMQKLEEEE